MLQQKEQRVRPYHFYVLPISRERKKVAFQPYRTNRYHWRSTRLKLTRHCANILSRTMLWRFYSIPRSALSRPSCIEELDAPLYRYQVVMRAISLAMDRGSKEKELVSRLFSVGFSHYLSLFQVTKGFEKLFERLSDLRLDCPHIADDLSKFLARAITDEVLPPSILNDFILKEYGAEVLALTETLLNMPRSFEYMERVWGARIAALEDIQMTKKLLVDAIAEFYDSHDAAEVRRNYKKGET